MPVGTRKFKPWNPTTGNANMSFEEYAARHQGMREPMLRDRYQAATSEAGGQKFLQRHEGDVAGAINQGRIRIIPEAVPGAAPSTPTHTSPTLSPGTPVDENSDLGRAVGAVRPDLPNRLAGLAQREARMLGRGRGAMKAAAEGFDQRDFNDMAGKGWTGAQKRKAFQRMTRKTEH
jgi:hypothetical protein